MDDDRPTIYDDVEYEPITTPSPAPGYTAVYGMDGEFHYEAKLVGWVVCRGVNITYIEEQGVEREIARSPIPNEIRGAVCTELGIELAEDVGDDFIGYREHESETLESFMDQYCPSDPADDDKEVMQ